MKMIRALALVLTGIAASLLQAKEVLRTAHAVMTAIYERTPAPFELDATIINPTPLLLRDDSGNMLASLVHPVSGEIKAGDICHVSGFVAISAQNHFFGAHINVLKVIGHAPPPAPLAITGEDFISGDYDLMPVVLHGTIDEYIPDEIDEDNQFLILQSGGVRIPLNISRKAQSQAECQALLGHEVTASGVGIPRPSTARRQIGRTLSLVEISGVSETTADIFAAPPLAKLRTTQPEILSRLGRHSVVGRVIASWNQSCALIRTDRGDVVRIEGPSVGHLSAGQRIEAVGFPETDLYTLILTRVVWRSCVEQGPSDAIREPDRVTLAKLLTDMDGKPRNNSRYHGRPIQFDGTVVALTRGDTKRLIVQQDGYTFPVDISRLTTLPDGLAVGSDVDITAVAVLETEKWRPNNIFPKINELIAVIRSPSDIVVTKAPSWWTTGRLLTALGLLIAVILVITVWNVLLRRLAERRGRELAQSEITRAESDLKTSERTRLAIELHDALSQNLTAVSMEIETAQQFLNGATPELKSHLGIAEKALDSCRSDLRNCLWDLRNEALETATMDEAVRTTLLPHVRDISLAVRFNVQRDALTDSTAHTILCIIRELTVNAIHHGHATHVAIAGTIDKGMLLFSVQDNGSGFDAEQAPGIAQGHFGLQGIRERVRVLGGSLEIASTPKTGTKATVRIVLHTHSNPT